MLVGGSPSPPAEVDNAVTGDQADQATGADDQNP